MVIFDYPQQPGELFVLNTSYRDAFGYSHKPGLMQLPIDEGEALLSDCFIPRKAKIPNNTPMLYLGMKSVYDTEYSKQKCVRYSFLTTSENGCAVEVFVLRIEAAQAFHNTIGFIKRWENT